MQRRCASLDKEPADDMAAKMTDSAARKYAALGNMEELQGHHAAALSDIGKALANSQSTQIKFLAANTYVDAGDVPNAKSWREASPPNCRASHRHTPRSSTAGSH